MLIYFLSLVIALAPEAPPPEPAGTIQGVVLNGSRDEEPLEGVEVVLRAGSGHELIPVAATTTDRYGKFVFEHVPPDPTLAYLPGANCDGVHYPGQRVQLDPSNRVAHVTIVGFDTVTAPSPLVAERHEIEVTVEQQALKITEHLVIANPTRTTYVGQSMGNGPPVTFWLSIPENFDRVTFDREFFGRRFLVVEHRPVTDIPWPPGEQELRFTYRLPLAESAGEFRRTLDLPSSHVRVRLKGASARQVTCNLPLSEAADGDVVFDSAGEQLPQAFTIDLHVGALPFPWVQYARWASVLVLIALVSATVAVRLLRSRKVNAEPSVSRQTSRRRRAA